MKKTTTGEIKRGLRKNVRRCKDLFQGLLETPNCRRDRLVSCINQTVDLTKLNIGLFNFSVYKPAYYNCFLYRRFLLKKRISVLFRILPSLSLFPHCCKVHPHKHCRFEQYPVHLLHF